MYYDFLNMMNDANLSFINLKLTIDCSVKVNIKDSEIMNVVLLVKSV